MQELARLVKGVTGPEKRALSAAYERVAESVLRRRRILNLVQEALSQLRLDVKYLMFDLETTRRERSSKKTIAGFRRADCPSLPRKISLTCRIRLTL